MNDHRAPYRATSEPSQGTPPGWSLTLENIVVHRQGTPVLRGIHLHIPSGCVLGIAGPNGAGKSTLGRVLTGLLEPGAGRILVNGIPTPPRALHGRSVFLDQEPYLLRRSVAANIGYALGRQASPERIQQALAQVGLPPSMAGRSWRELSGGEAKRVALAARLIRNPPVLVLDEPTANLDDAGIAAVEAVIRRRSGRATTVLISHDLHWLCTWTDHVEHVVAGELVGRGHITLLRGPWEPSAFGSVMPLGEHGSIPAPKAPHPKAQAVLPAQGANIVGDEDSRPVHVHGRILALFHHQGRIIVSCSVGGLRLWAHAIHPLPPGSPVGIHIEAQRIRFLE